MKSKTITPGQIDNAREFQRTRNEKRIAVGKLPGSYEKFAMPSGHLHLALEVDLTAGSYCWRYTYNRPSTGKLNRLSCGGVYPYLLGVGKADKELKEARAVQTASIKAACKKADLWTAGLEQGIDPADGVKDAKLAKAAAGRKATARAEAVRAKEAIPDSFRWHMEAILSHHAASWAPSYIKAFRSTLTKRAKHMLDLYPKDITEAHVKQMREDAYWDSGKLKGEMVGQYAAMQQVTGFYAQVMTEAGVPVLMPKERENKYPRPETVHHARLLSRSEIGKLVVDLLRLKGHPGARDGCLIALFTGQRTNIIHRMEWTEIDFEKATWTIPRPKTKGKTINKNSKAALLKPQVVPLSSQVLGMLERIRDNQMAECERTGGKVSKWVFPSRKRGATSGCMDRGTMAAMLRRAGYQDTHRNHGSRGTFCTVYQRERGLIWGQVCEAIIDHKWGKATVEATSGMPGVYHETEFGLRKQVLDDWGSMLFTWAQEYLEQEGARPRLSDEPTSVLAGPDLQLAA